MALGPSWVPKLVSKGHKYLNEDEERMDERMKKVNSNNK